MSTPPTIGTRSTVVKELTEQIIAECKSTVAIKKKLLEIMQSPTPPLNASEAKDFWTYTWMRARNYGPWFVTDRNAGIPAQWWFLHLWEENDLRAFLGDLNAGSTYVTVRPVNMEPDSDDSDIRHSVDPGSPRAVDNENCDDDTFSDQAINTEPPRKRVMKGGHSGHLDTAKTVFHIVSRFLTAICAERSNTMRYYPIKELLTKDGSKGLLGYKWFFRKPGDFAEFPGKATLLHWRSIELNDFISGLEDKSIVLTKIGRQTRQGTGIKLKPKSVWMYIDTEKEEYQDARLVRVANTNFFTLNHLYGPLYAVNEGVLDDVGSSHDALSSTSLRSPDGRILVNEQDTLLRNPANLPSQISNTGSLSVNIRQETDHSLVRRDVRMETIITLIENITSLVRAPVIRQTRSKNLKKRTKTSKIIWRNAKPNTQIFSTSMKLILGNSAKPLIRRSRDSSSAPTE